MNFILDRVKIGLGQPVGAQRGTFRFDINGLRGIAVLSVLCFHYGISGFSGGFVGVDIFFVISGFLMTGIINAGLAKPDFSVGQFYLRRFARIMPALTCVALFVVLAGWWLFLPGQYSVIAEEAVRSVTFSINHYFASRTGYFDPAATDSWFLHCWSLAVEFQYYLVLPIILWAARSISPRNGIRVALAVSIVVSLAISVFETKANQPSAFYLLPSRAWEFAAGGAIIFLPKARKLSRIFAWLGLFVIALAIGWLKPSVAFPGAWPLLPVIGTVLVIWAGSSSIVLLNRPLQFFGTISYSLYLWHWPLLKAATYFSLPNSPFYVSLMVVAATLLAWVSFLVIESPLRLAFNSKRRVPSVAVVGIVAVTLGLSWFVIVRAGLPGRISPVVAQMVDRAVYSNDWREGSCFLRPEQSYVDFPSSCFSAGKHAGKARLFIWGDSHAADLYPGIMASKWSDNFEVDQATLSACSPFGHAEVAARPHCAASRPLILKEILDNPPDVVLLSSAVVNYGTKGMDAMLAEEKSVGAQMAELVTKLRSAGIAVVVVGPVPQWKMPLPQAFFRYIVTHRGVQPSRLVPLGVDRMLRYDSTLRNAVIASGGKYVSPYKALCGVSSCDYAIPTIHGRVLVDFDLAHFTEDGARWAARELIGPALGQHDSPDLVEPGQTLKFNIGGNGVEYLASGWMAPEGWGSWSSSPEPGVIVLPLDKHARPKSIEITFWAQLASMMPQERFIVRVSGGSPSFLESNLSAATLTRTIPVGDQGRREIAESGTLHIEIVAPQAKSSKALGLNNDERVLGIGLRTIVLVNRSTQ